MSFTNPYLLWGSLAVAIPIIIHFWHRKRGTVIAWAATQWLIEKNQQQQRGFRFDDLLLLLVRSLLVLWLAFLLSQPIVNWFAKTEAVPAIHLVQPNALLLATYRFELETALKKGEKVYWINRPTEPVTKLDVPPQPDKLTVLSLQSAINKREPANAPLHLYVVNTGQLAAVPFICVPPRFQLHTVVDSARGQRTFVAIGQTKLFVNGADRLTNRAELPNTGQYAAAPTRSELLFVGLLLHDEAERQTVRAAFDALADVYNLKFNVTDPPLLPGQPYDVVVADHPDLLPANPSPRTLYLVSGVEPLTAGTNAGTNVIFVGESFGGQSDLVAGGQLPEWLGERLVAFLGLNPANVPLSQQQLDALFVPAKPASARSAADDPKAIQGGLLLVFLILVGAERWLALTKK